MDIMPRGLMQFNSLATHRCGPILKCVISKFIISLDIMSFTGGIVLKWEL